MEEEIGVSVPDHIQLVAIMYEDYVKSSDYEFGNNIRFSGYGNIVTPRIDPVNVKKA